MLASAQIRSWSPLAILLAALASGFALSFALGGDRAYPRDGMINEMVSKDLAIAGNLSPEHDFRLATRIWRSEDGGFAYDLYGRFPIARYILIRLAASPFKSDFAADLLAARVLSLLMFCGAAIFAYLALARIADSGWIALSAVLLAFSGFHALYFADSVAGESAADLFGAMLAFHGMVVFAQEGRFRQLLLKTCAALLLGWHVYALILPFALLSFGGEALALVRSALASGGGIRAAAAGLPALARSRFIALAAVAVLFGGALLAFNFANEYAAYGGESSLSDLPSAQSLMRRTGAGEDRFPTRTDILFFPDFWARQFMRAGAASVPYALAPSFGDWDLKISLSRQFFETAQVLAAAAAAGVLATAAALAGAALAGNRRLLLATLALFGFCWVIPFRYNLFLYEGVFFIGVPMAMATTALMGARALTGGRRSSARLAAVTLGLASAAVFALSALYEARPHQEANRMAEDFDIAMLSELRAMRDKTNGKSVLASSEVSTYVFNFSNHLVTYALAGSYLVYERRRGAPLDAYPLAGSHLARNAPFDFTASRYRNDAFDLLTPDNRFVFLYGARTDPEDLRRAERRRLEASEPAARAAFDVYLEGRTLRYLKAPCAPGDADAFFFAHFFPADAAYLGGDAAPAGFDGVNFPFVASGNVFDGACMATAHLPDYPIAAIRTGQFVSDSPMGRAASEEGAWAVSIFPPPSAETRAAYESAYRAVADSGDPAARSEFDVYLNGNNTISYLKRPCAEYDARGRFFLSVTPSDAENLPAERREIGHEALNFTFEPPHGVIFNGKCLATRQLPDYEIAKIETGQWIPGGDRLWDAEIAVGD